MKRRIHDLLNEAFDGLRPAQSTIRQGFTGVQRKCLRAPFVIKRPALSEPLANMEIECPEPSGADDEWTVVLVKVEKIEVAADFFARNERYDLAQAFTPVLSKIHRHAYGQKTQTREKGA